MGRGWIPEEIKKQSERIRELQRHCMELEYKSSKKRYKGYKVEVAYISKRMKEEM